MILLLRCYLYLILKEIDDNVYLVLFIATLFSIQLALIKHAWYQLEVGHLLFLETREKISGSGLGRLLNTKW